MPTPDASQYTQIKRMQTAITWQKNASPTKFRAPSPYQLPSYAGVGIYGFPDNVLSSNKFYVPPPPPFITLINDFSIQFVADQAAGENSVDFTFTCIGNPICAIRFVINSDAAITANVSFETDGYVYHSDGPLGTSDTIRFAIQPAGTSLWYFTETISVANDTTLTPTLTVSATTPI